MAENSKIEWTDNTFNPWIGCTRVSPGCQHCYAETLMDTRYGRVKWGPTGTRQRTSAANWKKPLQWNKQAAKEGKRVKVFCASLADVFEDNEQLINWRLDLFEQLIVNTPNLDWLILTKRPDIALSFFRLRSDLCLSNIRIGVSVEDQKRADKRRDLFKRIPIASKFVSYEPALGPVNWQGWEFIDWLICGGESGPEARPMHPEWARNARDWANGNGIAYHFKQWGQWIPKTEIGRFRDDYGWQVRPEWLEVVRGKEWGCFDIDGNYLEGTTTWNGRQNAEQDNFEVSVYSVGKYAAGRLLDGRTWDEFPEGVRL